MTHRRPFFFLCALWLAGCAPILSNPPPVPADDDDSTAGDDDDATGDDDDSTGDDDDDTWGDDDDSDPACLQPGTTESWVTGPQDVTGWVAGTVAVDTAAESVSLVTDVGEAFAWRVGADVGLLVGADGLGRVYWEQPGLAAWGGDFVFAVESADGAFRFISALVAGADEVFVADWASRFSVVRGACSELLDDFCGVMTVLPLQYEIANWDGVMLTGVLYPTLGEATGDFTIEHRLGRDYAELWCDDVDQTAWSFVMQQWMLTWDG